MPDKKLWTNEQETDFFTKSLEVASPEQLFYTTKDKKYYAYIEIANKQDTYEKKAEKFLNLMREINGR